MDQLNAPVFSTLAGFPRILCQQVTCNLVTVILTINVNLTAPAPSRTKLLSLVFRNVHCIRLNGLSRQSRIGLNHRVSRRLGTQNIQVCGNGPTVGRCVGRVNRQLTRADSHPGLPCAFRIITSGDVGTFTAANKFICVRANLVQTTGGRTRLTKIVTRRLNRVANHRIVGQVRRRTLTDNVTKTLRIHRSTLIDLKVRLTLSLPGDHRTRCSTSHQNFGGVNQTKCSAANFVAFVRRLRDQNNDPPRFLDDRPGPNGHIGGLRTVSPSKTFTTGTKTNASTTTCHTQVRNL